MRELLRPLLIVTLALLVPVVPFLGFGDRLDRTVMGWFDPPPAASVVAGLTVGVLAVDVLLPVPSSLVSTLAGAQLGVVAATAVSWVGMTVGAVVGFYLARRWGRPLAARFSGDDDLARMDHLTERYGAWVLILTRALPVLAEAAVLLVGATGLAWSRFLPAVMLSNLGIAAVYSTLGYWARSQQQLPLALAASIALPVAAATIARMLVHVRRDASPDAAPPPTS
jgi:membrane protein DedA with SNARE-associated domain